MSHGDLDLVINDPTVDDSQRMLLHSLAVMIEVPAVKPSPIERVPRTNSRTARTVKRASRRSRRRVRRKVYLAGCTLLALVPIVSACTLGWSNRPDRIIACSIPEPLQAASTMDRDSFSQMAPSDGTETATGQAMIASRRTAIVSGEAAAVAPVSAVEPPVILPGYLLPDDSREDVLHEGS